MGTRVISFHYTLTDQEGTTLDSSRDQEPMFYLEGSGQIIPGLEEVLQVLKLGDKKKVTIPADKAYGVRDDQHMIQVPRDKLPQGEIHVGDMFQSMDENAPPLTVAQVTATHVTLDANHPLAGKDLTFDVEIMEIRQATEEELTHGHAHGPGGHHHH